MCDLYGKADDEPNALRLHCILSCPVACGDPESGHFVLDSQRHKCTESNNYGLLKFNDSSCHKLQDRGTAMLEPRSTYQIGPRPPAYTSFPTLFWPHQSPFCFSHTPSSFVPQGLCSCCPLHPQICMWLAPAHHSGLISNVVTWDDSPTSYSLRPSQHATT